MEYQPEQLRLREIREEMGFSQEYVAYYLHTTRQQISKWEKGTQMMGVDKYIRLSALYGVTANLMGMGLPDDSNDCHTSEST